MVLTPSLNLARSLDSSDTGTLIEICFKFENTTENKR
jgi:hypothetical protein